MKTIEDRLQDSLARLDQQVDASAQDHETSPAQAEPLDLLVESASWLQTSASLLDPASDTISSGKTKLLSSLGANTKHFPSIHHYRSPFSTRTLVSHLLMALALFAAGFLAANSLINASQTWIPGDRLYRLKTIQEDLALSFNTSPARRASLNIQYAERRMLEAQALALEGRYSMLPATVEDFSRHVGGAVRDVRLSFFSDPAQGAELALLLEQTLNDQAALMFLLAGASPEPGSGQFHRMLSVSQDNLAALESLLSADGT